ncbi:MAG: hypothetical protein LUE12_06375 [Ruminococcus sp.]|nr:hypothetical protein [Ruminococcus sp.]
MKLSIGNRVKSMLQNWLEVVPAVEQTIVLNEQTTFNTDVLRSQIWYRGDSEELFQFFHQLQVSGVNSSFWGSVPPNEKIRKIHSGLPAIIADTLSFMVCSDFDGAKINDTKAQNIFDEQAQQFANVLSKAITDTLVDGDGAFKLSVDSEISDKPILEFVGADRVEYCCARGILNEVIFRTPIKDKSRTLFFEERYGKGYIESALLDANGIEQEQMLPQLEGIPRRVEFDGDYIMAIPLKFYASKKYPNRGKSIFDGGKSDCFDALDEVISQWWDAIRAGRVSK